MRVLVTGARGFIGRHVTHECAARSHQVIALSREDGDICDPKAVRTEVARARPDVIVHLAGQSSGARAFADPRESFRVNIIGTATVLESARAFAPGARIVVASSGEVYGREVRPDHHVDESSPPCPASPYAASKYAQEVVANQSAHALGPNVVIARVFTSVGPGQPSHFALPGFAFQLAKMARCNGERVLNVGNLNVRRDFTDVRDVAKALVILAEQQNLEGTFNVCSASSATLRDALNLIIDASGIDVEIETDPKRVRPVDLPYLVGDNTRLVKAGSWEPRIPLARSMSDLYAWAVAHDSGAGTLDGEKTRGN